MERFSRILCPVDLSDISQTALQHAAVVAGWYHSQVTVLHVCNPIVVPATDWARAGLDMSAMLTDDERRELVAKVDTCVKQAGIGQADVVVEHGPPAKQILAAATSLPADLIVIGTHGASGFEHLMLGSITEKVLRQAQCPVLTVPPRTRATSTMPFARILCPVDFSESSLAALDAAVSMTAKGGADLTVLYALDWPSEDFGPFTPEYRLDIERSAREELSRLVAARHAPRAHLQLASGKAYREILAAAADGKADVIVMGVHGRNALDLMLFGSTTNQVVRRATCPVLTLRG